MKNKLSEPMLHWSIKNSRRIFNLKFLKFISDIASIIDDLIHFDFEILQYSIENKETSDKISDMSNELAILEIIYEHRGTDCSADYLKTFNLNSEYLSYIEDPEVIKYLALDTKLYERLDKLKYFDLLEKWYTVNNLTLNIK